MSGPNLTVNTPECTLLDLTKILAKDENVHAKWEGLAAHLELPGITITELKRKGTSSTITTFDSLIREMLVVWRGQNKSSNATIGVIVKAAEACGLGEVAEILRNKYEATLVVNTQGRILLDLTNILAKDENVHEKWEGLAAHLKLTGIAIKELKEKRMSAIIMTFNSLIREMLVAWRGQNKSCDATIGILVEAVEACGLEDVAEVLRIKYGFPLPKKDDPTDETSSNKEGFLSTKEILPDGAGPSCFGRNVKSKQVIPEGKIADGLTPLDVEVVLPSTSRKVNIEDEYPLPTTGKGLAFILNNTENRDGASVDTKNLTKLLTDLGYTVKIKKQAFYSNKFKGKDHLRLKNIIETCKDEIDDDTKSILVFIGSHGLKDTIFTTDDKPVNLYDDIIYEFSHENCKELIGKPKIFWVEACRPFNKLQKDDEPPEPELTYEDWVTKRQSEIHSNYMTDTVICQSTPPGYWALRNERIGSVFVYSLCKVLMNNPCEKDLVTLMSNEISEEMAKCVELTKGEPPFAIPALWRAKKIYFNVEPKIQEGSLQ